LLIPYQRATPKELNVKRSNERSEIIALRKPGEKYKQRLNPKGVECE